MLRKLFTFGLGTILILNLICFQLYSCKGNTKKSELVKPGGINGIDSLNLLRFKVKEDHFKKDGLKLDFTEVYLSSLREHEFELKILFDELNNDSIAYTDNYLIFSIYPKDEDIEMLHSERRKYGFEAYSLKMAIDENGKLSGLRKINTKLNYARAITIGVYNYEPKEKRTEIVLRNVPF